MRPDFEPLGAGPLPAWMRAYDRALRWAPVGVRRQLERAAWRLLARRMPAFVARFADGRAFRVGAGDHLYAQVFVYGAYEATESAAVRHLLRPGDFAIDIGANNGWYTLLMAATVGESGRVLAAEPVPAMLAELHANLALNDGLDAEVLELALGERPGTAELHVFAGLVPAHASISTLGREDYVSYPARVQPLDEVLADEDRAPAFVKLDVEGSERAVLAGAKATIDAPRPPIWMVEVNEETSAAFGYSPPELLNAFDPDRYEVFRLLAEGLAIERDPGSAPHGAMWICVPNTHHDRVRKLLGNAPSGYSGRG